MPTEVTDKKSEARNPQDFAEGNEENEGNGERDRLPAAARWAQAATAKAEIQTGNVSNGTVHLVTIATNYPSLLGSIRYHDVWRKADWALFEQLRSGTNRQTSSLKN